MGILREKPISRILRKNRWKRDKFPLNKTVNYSIAIWMNWRTRDVRNLSLAHCLRTVQKICPVWEWFSYHEHTKIIQEEYEQQNKKYEERLMKLKLIIICVWCGGCFPHVTREPDKTDHKCLWIRIFIPNDALAYGIIRQQCGTLNWIIVAWNFVMW